MLDRYAVAVIKDIMELNIEKIRREMQRMDINQARLAELSKVEPATISWLLKNKRTTFGTLDKISKALGVESKDLLTS